MGPNDAPAAEKKQDAKEVGLAFAKKYYEGAIRGPEGVMELFGGDSVYVGTNGKEAHGLEDIRNAIGNLNLQEGKILVVSIQAAFTCNGGIMVQSIANYIAESAAKYGFTESFHLVPQSKGWYVHSCLFKWHDKSPEDDKSKDTSPTVVEEPNHELANGHTETKKHELETDAKVAEEVKKPSNEGKAGQPKDRILSNGTSTPPSTPIKNPATPQKEAKSSPAPAATNTAQPPAAAPAPSAPPAAPTSWAQCVGGIVKSAAAPSVANTNVKSAATTNNAASDVTVKSPTTNTTTANAAGNASTNVEGTHDKQHRQRKPPRAKSDYTVHVSKIIKGKKATEKDVVIDITKAFQEFGPIAHVRVPGRRLGDDNEKTLYAFVDFKDKEDFEKIFADREQDNEGRVKLTINLPVLQFEGEVIIAQNHDRAAAGGRNFYRNRRGSDNIRPAAPGNGNNRPGNGRPPRNRRPSRNNGQPGNRPPQTGNRNPSDNRRKESGTIKAKN